MSRLLGSTVSVAVHALVAVLLLRPADLKVRTTSPIGSQARAVRSAAAQAQPGVEIFVVPQPETGEAPGLKSFSAGQEPFEYSGSIDSTAVPLPGFTFDFKKVLGSGDARYLIGSIYWRHGNRTGAIDAWRGITVDQSDSYVTAYSDVLKAIRASGDAADSSLRGQVERALDAERGRWRDFSYTRLRQFGYRFDTY